MMLKFSCPYGCPYSLDLTILDYNHWQNFRRFNIWANLLIIHIMELSTFCVWTKYNGYKLQQQCPHGALQSCKLPMQVTDSRKAFSQLVCLSACLLIIRTIYNHIYLSLFLVSQASVTATNYTNAYTVYGDCKPISILHDSHVKIWLREVSCLDMQSTRRSMEVCTIAVFVGRIVMPVQ